MENEITTNDLAVVPQQNIGGVYDRINDPMLAIKTLGMSIFKSGIFGLDKPEQGEILADHEHSIYQRSANARRAGLSKREIMEELSRERFPWDE